MHVIFDLWLFNKSYGIFMGILVAHSQMIFYYRWLPIRKNDVQRCSNNVFQNKMGHDRTIGGPVKRASQDVDFLPCQKGPNKVNRPSFK